MSIKVLIERIDSLLIETEDDLEHTGWNDALHEVKNLINEDEEFGAAFEKDAQFSHFGARASSLEERSKQLMGMAGKAFSERRDDQADSLRIMADLIDKWAKEERKQQSKYSDMEGK